MVASVCVFFLFIFVSLESALSIFIDFIQTTRFSVFHFLPCILILNLVDVCSGLYYFFFFFPGCL